MKVYSYIVKNDAGFSPNPFHGLCTLACCKPKIRKGAHVGDVIVGMSTKGEKLIYAMKVSRAITFEDYWSDQQYSVKRPAWESARAIDRSGDNIYEPTAIGAFRQLPSCHSHPDGSENLKTKVKDLSGNQVLVAKRFAYYGQSGPAIPPRLGFLTIGRGHRCNFTSKQVLEVERWFDSLPQGNHGQPKIWAVDDASWRRC